MPFEGISQESNSRIGTQRTHRNHWLIKPGNKLGTEYYLNLSDFKTYSKAMDTFIKRFGNIDIMIISMLIGGGFWDFGDTLRNFLFSHHKRRINYLYLEHYSAIEKIKNHPFAPVEIESNCLAINRWLYGDDRVVTEYQGGGIHYDLVDCRETVDELTLITDTVQAITDEDYQPCYIKDGSNDKEKLDWLIERLIQVYTTRVERSSIGFFTLSDVVFSGESLLLPPYLDSMIALLSKALKTDLINETLPLNKLKELITGIHAIINQYHDDSQANNRLRIEEPQQLYRALQFTITEVLLPPLQSHQYDMSTLKRPGKLKLE